MVSTRAGPHGPVSGFETPRAAVRDVAAYFALSYFALFKNGASHSGVTSAGKSIAWDRETSIAE